MRTQYQQHKEAQRAHTAQTYLKAARDASLPSIVRCDSAHLALDYAQIGRDDGTMFAAAVLLTQLQSEFQTTKLQNGGEE